jgi:hypothetical protein
MRAIFSFFLILLFSACSAINESEDNAHHKIIDTSADIKSDCVLTVNPVMSCSLSSANGEVQLTVNLDSISDGEWIIKNLKLQGSKSTQILKGSEAITLFEGDSLIVKYRDINFDNRADIAVSTSFGTPNLYFDYWINSQKDEYQFLGNYPDFEIDANTQKLTANVKSNAATYRRQIWTWRGTELIEE